MTQVTDIRTLQDIDDEVSGLRDRLEEVERRLLGNEELDAARSAFAAADAELMEARRQQRRVEGEVEGLTAKITPEEKRLYDGSVRNPKELGNIQHEVELLKGQRAKLEDELLEVMSRLEAAEMAHGGAQKGLVRAEARWEADRERLGQESARLNASVAAAEAKRLAQRAKISPRNLDVYEDIRKRRGGVAVSRVSGSNCTGCRVSIPEAIRRRAFTGDLLAQCPNCERILYVG